MAYSTGKLAVITGAGSGIGRALALRLNGEGCRLLLSDINPESLESTLKALPRPDVSTQTRVLDVADRKRSPGSEREDPPACEHQQRESQQS